MRARLARLGLAATFCLAAAEAGAAADPENTLVLELSTGGPVVIEMFPDLAPRHVARIKELVREGFYDGIVFHRVIEGFMAQTGDPTGTGRGGSGRGTLPAEFSKVPFERGVVGMARTPDPNSADSQFFIMFARAPHLDGQYTVWGRVVRGMEYVDRIARTEPRRPEKLDRMIRVRLASDLR
ncbi:MAG: peptidylprolyl isomerase [Geminicoccaceae bacterium]|nr:peptidylprolyl isomerase [Geminicoccaceae bacterium]MCS7266983.1 peptidylprolyl isomerase [Geminicoccaceae bacterium]MCX7628791.1 peptidylprolyl isomerase [Geminicoccaceae bacterium]MDW8123396.1 peptidylprolyl isomerase [Geminicoccaceae bacterium]MDW8341650.1 peptidylprolyl isomerase [Geminicoccaceae bacterium]